jgi:hypothetical protein
MMRWVSSVRSRAVSSVLPLLAVGWVLFGVAGNRWG